MIQQNKNRGIQLHIGEIFYYLFWITMIYAKGTGLYEGMRVYNICLVLAMGFLAVKLLLTRYSLTDLMWMVPVTLLGLWVYLHSKDQSALILAAMVIGLKDVSLPRVFGTGLAMWGGCFVFLSLRALTGGYAGPFLVHEKLGLGPILRWSLGYTHPNVLQITYVVISAFILYLWNLKPGRKQWKISLLLMAGNLYVFLYSISFTGFLLMLVLLFFNLYLSNRKRVSRIEYFLLQCVFPFSVLFSLAGPMILGKNGPVFQFVTKLLNTRYSATRIYLEALGVTLFGIDVPKLHGFAIDCSYTEAILSYGCILFALIVIGCLYTIKRLTDQKRWRELAIILSLLVAGISEPFLFNTSFKNITMLLVGNCVFDWSARLAERKKGTLLGKEIALLSGWNRSFIIPDGRLEELVRRVKEKLYAGRKKFRGIILAAGIVCMAVAAVFVQNPDSIFIGIGNTDCGEREVKYLDMQNLPEGFNSVVYEYPGPDGGMYEFEGNIITLEYVRKIVSAGVWGMAGCVCVILMGCGLIVLGAERKKSNSVRES